MTRSDLHSPNTNSKSVKKRFPNVIFLFLCAIIWGFGFIAQRLGNQHVGPFTFNGIRFLLGALTVSPLLLVVRRAEEKEQRAAGISASESRKKTCSTRRAWFIGSLFCGLALFAGASFQQIGLISTEAGKAGFITALYIILVPLIGLLLGKRVSWNVWIGLVLAVGGLYLLMVEGDFNVATSDLIILIGAFLWALHILAVDHHTEKVDGIRLAFGQFLVSGLLSFSVALAREQISWLAIKEALLPLLFSGVIVAGVAFTFQVLGQRGTNPTLAALIMSLEAVFAVIGGILVLNERMSSREWLGSALMLIALIIAQLKFKEQKNANHTPITQNPNI